MRNIFEYHDEGIYLEHHGIKGQKWGVRRFQNPDGSLTEAGKKRYKQIIDKLDIDTSHVIYDVATGKMKPPRKWDAAEEKAYRDHDKRAAQKAESEVKAILNMPSHTTAQKAKKLQSEREFFQTILDSNNNTDINTNRGAAVSKRIFELLPDGSAPSRGIAKQLGFTDNADNDEDLYYIWSYFGM